MAALATSAPMAPRPMTPSVLPKISWPAKAFFAFSASLPMVGESACSRHQAAPGQDAAACQQHAAQNELLHGVRVGAGGVEHDDAGFGALVKRDVVHTRAGAGDGQQAFGKVHVVHGGAAHEHAGSLRDVVGELIVGSEQVGSFGGDVVQAVDVAHERPLRRVRLRFAN